MYTRRSYEERSQHFAPDQSVVTSNGSTRGPGFGEYRRASANSLAGPGALRRPEPRRASVRSARLGECSGMSPSSQHSLMRMDVCIRSVAPDEGERLREIAIAAKGYWGYETDR